MTTQEVCEDCGSGINYREYDDTSISSNSRSVIQVPYSCKNSACPNSDPDNISIGGFTTTREV